jgi:hypothetical protein
MENTKIEFIDTSQECIAMMKKLSKDALKQGGKIVTNILKEKVPVRRGYFKKAIKAWAKIDYKTGQPYLEVGYLSRSQMRKKYGIKYFVNPTWFEFGAKPHTIQTKQLKKGQKLTYELEGNGRKYGYSVEHPGMSHRNYLRNTAYENIDKIQSAIQEGLCKLEDYTITQGMKIDLGGDEEID